MISRRMLGFETLWAMLKDFDVCPGMCRLFPTLKFVYYISCDTLYICCSKKNLLNLCKDIMATSSSQLEGGSGSFDLGNKHDESSINAHSTVSRPWDEQTSKLCFVDFKKVYLVVTVLP